MTEPLMADNDSNTSTSTSDNYEKCTFTNGILIRYVGTSIFLIGIISTVLSACVFARKPLRRKSCCFYFLILAISDAIHLFTTTIEYLPYGFRVDIIVLHSVVCKSIIFLIYFSNHLSNIVLTLASIDRFILIYYPSHSKRFCKTKKAKCLVALVMIILLFSTGHILYGYEKIPLNAEGSTSQYDCNILNDNVFYRNFFNFYDSYIESILFVSIPFIIMTLCSTLIIFQIVEKRRTIRNNNRNHNNRLRDKDIQLCCMLIGTSFAFLVLCLPAEINDLFNYVGEDRSCADWFRKVVLMLMQQIYFAGHFYIYILTSELFRRHLCEILLLYRRQNTINHQETFPFGAMEPRSSIKTEHSQLKIAGGQGSIRICQAQLNEGSLIADPSTRHASVSK